MSSLSNLAPTSAPIAAPSFSTGAIKDAVPVMIVSANSYNLSNKFGNTLLVFIIMICFFWIALFTFNPKMVQSVDANGTGKPLPDTARCFIGSLVLSFILVVIWWLFRSCS